MILPQECPKFIKPLMIPLIPAGLVLTILFEKQDKKDRMRDKI